MPIEADDILINKASIIQRCIGRIQEEYAYWKNNKSYTHEDAMLLNIERSCQACIDMATHVVAKEKWGVIQKSSEAFEILNKQNVIDAHLAASLKAMVGFRNIAVHEYQQINLDILTWIVNEGFQDWIKLCQALGININKS